MQPLPPQSPTRALVQAALALCLLIPAAAVTPEVLGHVRDWRRLRAAGREAPDVGWDRAFLALSADLPPSGRIGFVDTTGATGARAARLFYFLQYALAPRVIRQSADEEFVIVYGAAPSPDVQPPSFRLVKQAAEDLRVYRRVQ